MRRNDWSNQSRFSGWSGALCMALALALSITSVAVVAQTAFDFEDPLEEVRSKIERAAPAESDAPLISPTPVPAAERNTALAPDVDAKGPVRIMAERLGLPTAGLVGLGLLALLGLILALMWMFGLRKAGKTVNRKDRELYAVANGSRGRRTLESGSKISRNRKQTLDTEEESELAAPSAAAAAARVLSGERDDDEMLTPAFVDDDAQQNFVDDELSDAYGSAGDQTADAGQSTNPDDPSTWKRPNLDRLKQSIRDDWKGDKAESAENAREAAEDVAPARSEADAFAELFGEEEIVAETREASKRPVIDILDDFEDDRSPMSVSALRDAVEKTVDGTGAATRTRPPLPSRSDAVRRIKALRESVKAS